MPVADAQIAEPPGADDLVRMPLSLTSEQTNEVDHARRMFQFAIEEVLLGALSRTIAHTLGEGVIAVNLTGDGRSILKPDVDPRRTVGGFATIYPIALTCVSRENADAMQVLDEVHNTVKAVPHHGIGHGLLRYLYAPTARLLGVIPTPDIFLNNEGMIPDLPPREGPVQFDLDSSMPVRDKVPGLGHAIEVRVYRAAGVLHCDWWYDTRRLPTATVEALVTQFPVALNELITEAIATSRSEAESDGATGELALVDLSGE
jgi:phthiocerol/phenolphthiocerol synthesis type-I polyketide synthase E